MKKLIVSVLCSALLMSGLTACGKTPADAEVSQASESEVSVASSTAEVPESEASSEASEEVVYVVELTSYNDSKVAVIKAYREITGLGLKEAKDTIDLAPCVILETTDEEEANQYKTALETAGATVTINDGTASTTETEASASSETPSETAEIAAESTEASTSEAPGTTGATYAVDSVFYITGTGTVLTGTIEQGCIKMGDSAVIILEDGTEIPATINRIEVFGELLEEAEAGKNVGLGFEEDITKESVLTAVSVVIAVE